MAAQMLDFLHTFAIYVDARPSVCLSSVCYVRVPYSGDKNFRQCFYAIWYLGHPLTTRQNFTKIVGPRRTPLSGVKRNRTWQI